MNRRPRAKATTLALVWSSRKGQRSSAGRGALPHFNDLAGRTWGTPTKRIRRKQPDELGGRRPRGPVAKRVEKQCATSARQGAEPATSPNTPNFNTTSSLRRTLPTYPSQPTATSLSRSSRFFDREPGSRCRTDIRTCHGPKEDQTGHKLRDTNSVPRSACGASAVRPG